MSFGEKIHEYLYKTHHFHAEKYSQVEQKLNAETKLMVDKADYENEKEYRKQDCIKTISIQEELGISYTFEVEVDFDKQTLIGDPYDWSSHIDKLKELQIIMDSENVKEKVSEGVYLEMMNGLRDLYNMCQ